MQVLHIFQSLLLCCQYFTTAMVLHNRSALCMCKDMQGLHARLEVGLAVCLCRLYIGYMQRDRYIRMYVCMCVCTLRAWQSMWFALTCVNAYYIHPYVYNYVCAFTYVVHMYVCTYVHMLYFKLLIHPMMPCHGTIVRYIVSFTFIHISPFTYTLCAMCVPACLPAYIHHKSQE